METNKNDRNSKNRPKKEPFPGYQHYTPNEDIYRQETEASEIDPETLGKKQSAKDNDATPGLDIPGTALDDEQEDVGSEDEENNYYSLGGENHENLEEPKDNNLNS